MIQPITIRNTLVIDQTLTYTAENVANKDIDGTLASNSDTKYPSQKAVKTYADAKVEDDIVNDVTTKAPSQNAVFDALAGKQATLVSNTNIKTVNGVSVLGSGNIDTIQFDSDIEAVRGFNSSLIAQTAGVPFQTANTLTTLVDGTALYGALFVPKAVTANGIAYFMRVSGVFTADNENSLALYSVNQTTGDLTRVAISANAGSNFTGTAQTFKQVAFTAPVNLSAGVYVVGCLWNTSGIPTTAPAIASGVALQNSAMCNVLMLPNTKLYGTQALTSQGSGFTSASITVTTITPWFGLY